MSPDARLPFGSDLVRCLHRLARLQLAQEMHPRPTIVERTEEALDRVIVAARDLLSQEEAR
jgi:hypothetical protein